MLTFLVSLITATSVTAQIVLVPRNAFWTYEDTGTDLGTAWQPLSYNDATWDSAQAPLGYGEPFIMTATSFGPDQNNKYPTTYFRHEFTFTELSTDITFLELEANFDDGFVAYLNGTEVLRRSMPVGAVAYSTFASLHEGGAFEGYDITAFKSSLITGLNILAVEVHQANTSSSDLVADFALSYSTTPEFVTRGPYIQTRGDTTVTIRWRTNAPTTSAIRYGTSLGSPGEIESDTTATTEHEIRIDGLTSDTKYFYEVGNTTETIYTNGASTYFTTAPPVGVTKQTRVWVIGDSGEANQNARDVASAYLNFVCDDPAEVWLMLGDNAYGSGTDAQYQAAVFDIYPTFLENTALFPTRGNHDDLHAGGNNDYYDIFTMPVNGELGGVASGSESYYSFDHANIHFICLDSDGTSRAVNGAMANWLRSDLAATSQEWIIAFWHHPPYTKGSHNSDNAGDSSGRLFDMRENFLPILDSAGVDIVLCGHSHSYERSYLLNGHYDVSTTLAAGMIIDSSDGSLEGDGAYEKESLVKGQFEGCIYAVPGSSSKISGGLLNHPVMVTSLNELGSMVINVMGSVLDAVFVDETSVVRDRFRIIKGVPGSAEGTAPPVASVLRLFPIGPTPSVNGATIRYALPEQRDVNVAIYDISGRLVRMLVDDDRPPGEHLLTWDGANTNGRTVATGTYFAVLRSGEDVRTRKISFVK